MSSRALRNLQQDWFIPELMDTSRVTERGSTYNSKSKNNSILKSSCSGKSSIISNVPHQTVSSSQDTLQSLFTCINKRQTLAVVENIQEKTNRKTPIYKEAQVSSSWTRVRNSQENLRHSSLLSSQLSKRTSGEYEFKEKQSILKPYLKQSNLHSIRQERVADTRCRLSGQEIDSDLQIRNSFSTDISQE